MKKFWFLVAPLTILAFTAKAKVDFAREVLPVLSNKCFVCHGPDTRKKDLVRLDSFKGATRDLGGYRAIDIEKPAESEILIRIKDQEDPMPPKDAEKQLTATEKEIISQWIREGGQYAKHWAFVSPTKPKAVGNGTPSTTLLEYASNHQVSTSPSLPKRLHSLDGQHLSSPDFPQNLNS